jgi:hypothetical protein
VLDTWRWTPGAGHLALAAFGRPDLPHRGVAPPTYHTRAGERVWEVHSVVPAVPFGLEFRIDFRGDDQQATLFGHRGGASSVSGYHAALSGVEASSGPQLRLSSGSFDRLLVPNTIQYAIVSSTDGLRGEGAPTLSDTLWPEQSRPSYPKEAPDLPIVLMGCRKSSISIAFFADYRNVVRAGSSGSRPSICMILTP